MSRKDSVREVDTKIKRKIGDSNWKLGNQSVFLFVDKKVLNRGNY